MRSPPGPPLLLSHVDGGALLLSIDDLHFVIAPGTALPGRPSLPERRWPTLMGVLILGPGGGPTAGPMSHAPRLLPHAAATMGPIEVTPIDGGCLVRWSGVVLSALNGPSIAPIPAPPITILHVPTMRSWEDGSVGSRYAIPLGAAPDSVAIRKAAGLNPLRARPLLLAPGEQVVFRGREDDLWLAQRRPLPGGRADRWGFLGRFAGLSDWPPSDLDPAT